MPTSQPIKRFSIHVLVVTVHTTRHTCGNGESYHSSPAQLMFNSDVNILNSVLQQHAACPTLSHLALLVQHVIKLQQSWTQQIVVLHQPWGSCLQGLLLQVCPYYLSLVSITLAQMAHRWACMFMAIKVERLLQPLSGTWQDMATDVPTGSTNWKKEGLACLPHTSGVCSYLSAPIKCLLTHSGLPTFVVHYDGWSTVQEWSTFRISPNAKLYQLSDVFLESIHLHVGIL